MEDQGAAAAFAFAQALQSVVSVAGSSPWTFDRGQMVEQIPSVGRFFFAFGDRSQPPCAVVAIAAAIRGFGDLIERVKRAGDTTGFGAVPGFVVSVARRAFAGRVEFGEAVESVV